MPQSPSRTRWLNTPNSLTLLRLALLPVFIGLLLAGASHRSAAVGVLLVMALTDALDGPLARRLNQVSQLGTYLDPTADKLLVNASVLLLAMPSVAPAGFRIPLPLVAGIYLKDAGVLIGAAVVRARVGRVGIAAARYGKLATLSQLTLIFLTLLGPLLLRWGSSSMAGTLFWLGQWTTLICTAAAAVGYSLEGARQLRAHHGADMTPEPSKQLRDIAPPAVPDEVMQKVHEANEHLKQDRAALEAATSNASFDSSAHLSEASRRLRDTEHELEEAEAKVRDAIHPPEK